MRHFQNMMNTSGSGHGFSLKPYDSTFVVYYNSNSRYSIVSNTTIKGNSLTSRRNGVRMLFNVLAFVGITQLC